MLIFSVVSFLTVLATGYSSMQQVSKKAISFNTCAKSIKENTELQGLEQDDPEVLKFIRNGNFLVPPSEKQYNLEAPTNYSSHGQPNIVKRIFKNMTNGYFVECGALDGETRSNTLELERDFGWKGILIEGSPKNAQLALEKNRKAWFVKACAATKPYLHQVLFRERFNVGRISGDPNRRAHKRNEVTVQCFPIYSIFSALNVTVIDYLSLDVEGDDYQVLKTIPFNRILIKVISVEFIQDPARPKTSKKKSILKYMYSKGYRFIGEVMQDLILVHPSVDIPKEFNLLCVNNPTVACRARHLK